MKFPRLEASAVWRTTPELLLMLHARFGEPLDAYVNGSQVWLREDGPKETTLEWRLHPIAGYERPGGLSTQEVFPTVVFELSSEDAPTIDPGMLWDGLECFAAFGEDIEPAVLSASAVTALGIPPDRVGLVDHKAVGDEWERSQGATSIIDGLWHQLESSIDSGDLPST